MQVINLKPVFRRLAEDRKIQLLKHIFAVQGAELKRLDYSAAAKALNASRAQIARDVQVLARVGLILVKGGELCLAPEILIEKG